MISKLILQFQIYYDKANFHVKIFQMKEEKKIKLVHKQGNLTCVVQKVILGKLQYWIWNPHRISKSKKTKY